MCGSQMKRNSHLQGSSRNEHLPGERESFKASEATSGALCSIREGLCSSMELRRGKVNFIWAERTGRPCCPNTFQRDETLLCLGKTSRAEVFTAAQQPDRALWALRDRAVCCHLSSLLGSRRWTTAGHQPQGHHPWWTRRQAVEERWLLS